MIFFGLPLFFLDWHALWGQRFIMVLTYVHRFAVNLRCGSVGDIGLSYSPRFNEGEVVRNTYIGVWGDEERSGGMPFAKDQRFVLNIQVESGCYTVCFSVDAPFSAECP